MHKFETVIHLAAQAGVRYSLENPRAYGRSNLDGFLNILEACRHHRVGHLVYASSSSVYGAVTKMPFSVAQNVDHPVSLYAATKKANELMAHAYSHVFGLPTTGLRFFTVYGPWGRPDMALFLFTKAMLAGQPIQVFNHGRMQRDFTYIDDIVEGVKRIAASPPRPTPLGAATRPRRRRASRPGASTTSATTGPSSCCASSSFWRKSSASRRRRSFCRCSPATCRRPMPTSTTSPR